MNKKLKRFFSTVSDPRNKLIYYMMYHTGLNMCKIIKIKRNNLDLKKKQLMFNTSNRMLKLNLSEDLVNHLKDFLQNEPQSSVYLFENSRTARPVSRQAIHIAFQRYCKRANIDLKLRDIQCGDFSQLPDKQKNILTNLPLTAAARRMSQTELRNGNWREPYYKQMFELITF